MEVQPEIRDARLVYHFWVDDVVIDTYGEHLGPYGLGVYIALCRRAKQGKAFPGHARLAKDTGMSRASVRRALERCRDLGLITIEHRFTSDGNPTSNLYTIVDLSPHALKPRAPQNTPLAPQTPPMLPQSIPPMLPQSIPGSPQSTEVVPPEGEKKERSSTPGNPFSHFIAKGETPEQRPTDRTPQPARSVQRDRNPNDKPGLMSLGDILSHAMRMAQNNPQEPRP